MKWIAVTMFLGPVIVMAGTYHLTPTQLKFTYQNFEGDLNVHCTHSLEDADAHDWLVHCEKAKIARKGIKAFTRDYRVHLWLTKYERTLTPKLSLEILYWVTDRTTSPATGHSTTNWLHFKEPSQLTGTSFSVGVDQDTAGLYLDIDLNISERKF